MNMDRFTRFYLLCGSMIASAFAMLITYHARQGGGGMSTIGGTIIGAALMVLVGVVRNSWWEQIGQTSSWGIVLGVAAGCGGGVGVVIALEGHSLSFALVGVVAGILIANRALIPLPFRS